SDWQTGLYTGVAGHARVLVGSDGGLFSSANVFDAGVAPTAVEWDFHNRGLVTHLCYSVGSGDPADGNPFTVFTGLQDDGTRFRDAPEDPTIFNQVVGGDGTGTALGKGTAGQWYWTSAQYKRFYCRPALKSCNQGGSWTEVEPALVNSSDTQPFFVRFAPVQTDPSGAAFLTATTYGVFRSDAAPTWTLLKNTYPTAIREVFASQTTPGLYGAVLNGGRATVTSDGGSTWTTAAGQIGVGSQRPTLASSIAFPPVIPPDLPPGKAAGDVYLLATRAWVLTEATPIPAAVGHLFLTTDRGATFTALHGDGSGQDLPNLPIYVVRYDPADPTGATIYVGTA